MRDHKLKNLTRSELIKICDGYGIDTKNASHQKMLEKISLRENSEIKTSEFPADDKICCSLIKSKKKVQIRCSNKAKKSSLFCPHHVTGYIIDISSQKYINWITGIIWTFLPNKIIETIEGINYKTGLLYILLKATNIIVEENLQIPKRCGLPAVLNWDIIQISRSPEIVCCGVWNARCYGCSNYSPKIMYNVPYERNPPITTPEPVRDDPTFDNVMSWSFKYKKSYTTTVSICEKCFIKLMNCCDATRTHLLKLSIQYYLLADRIGNKIDNDCKKKIISLIFSCRKSA